MVTRTTTITDPVGIHARPAAKFAQAILSIMGLGIKQGDTVEVTVDGDNAETVIDSLIETLTAAE